jgi:hypothetical protein
MGNFEIIAVENLLIFGGFEKTSILAKAGTGHGAQKP